MAYSLLATYHVGQEFKLPKCLRDDSVQSLEDLNKHPLINEWWIKWGCLNIEWKDGTSTEIEGSEELHDYKRPDDIEVCEKQDSCLTDDEDENTEAEGVTLDDWIPLPREDNDSSSDSSDSSDSDMDYGSDSSDSDSVRESKDRQYEEMCHIAGGAWDLVQTHYPFLSVIEYHTFTKKMDKVEQIRGENDGLDGYYPYLENFDIHDAKNLCEYFEGFIKDLKDRVQNK